MKVRLKPHLSTVTSDKRVAVKRNRPGAALLETAGWNVMFVYTWRTRVGECCLLSATPYSSPGGATVASYATIRVPSSITPMFNFSRSPARSQFGYQETTQTRAVDDKPYAAWDSALDPSEQRVDGGLWKPLSRVRRRSVLRVMASWGVLRTVTQSPVAMISIPAYHSSERTVAGGYECSACHTPSIGSR